MTELTDLTIPLSALQFESASQATATAMAWDNTQISALLQSVVQRHAASFLEDGSLHPVSVTFDVSADAATGTDVRFESRIDRRTRTLTFASGLALQGDSVLVKATVIYRIG